MNTFHDCSKRVLNNEKKSVNIKLMMNTLPIFFFSFYRADISCQCRFLEGEMAKGRSEGYWHIHSTNQSQTSCTLRANKTQTSDIHRVRCSSTPANETPCRKANWTQLIFQLYFHLSF